MRKTKIVCTIGPSCNSLEGIKGLIKAGMNVARINMSHGEYAYNKEVFKTILKAREECKTPLAVMLDTKGPEIRIGTFKNKDGVILEKGKQFVLSTTMCEGDENQVFVNYKGLVKDLKTGDKILVNDGLVELKVKSVNKDKIITTVVTGGKLTDRKSCFVPGVELNMPFLSEQDKLDIKLAVELKLNYVAASFVSKKQDAIDIKNYLNKIGGKDIEIIAKIESVEGVKNVKEIAEVVDGIMVARGDLGVEYSFEKIPAIQKLIIDATKQNGKLLIMATEMLDTMTKNIRPTRAEANDVANAVFEKCSAVMLSGETAVGVHPNLVVETMAKICVEAEKSMNYENEFNNLNFKCASITDAISHTAVRSAFDLNSNLIIAFTMQGDTAKNISKFNPSANILALTTNKFSYNKLAFYFGVTPIMCDKLSSTDEMFKLGKELAVKNKFAKKGDVVVISAGLPVGEPGQTNVVKIDTIQ